MVATGISYFSAVGLFFMGTWGLFRLAYSQVRPGNEFSCFAVSVLFFAAAWGCAYLGGI